MTFNCDILDLNLYYDIQLYVPYLDRAINVQVICTT